MGDDVHDVNDSQSSVGSAGGKSAGLLKVEFSRPFFLVASKSGKVMDAKKMGAENNGTQQIQLWDKNGSESQRWVLEADGSIANPASGRVIDVGDQAINGAKIQLSDKSGSASQLWAFLADGSIVNRATGMALDVAGGDHTNGALIQCWDHNRSSPAQLWHLEPFP